MVELLIVIVIISMLAALTGFAYTRQQAESRTSRKIADVKTIAAELDAYYQKNGNYPVTCGLPSTNTAALRACSGTTSTSAPYFYTSGGLTAPAMLPVGGSASSVKNVLPGFDMNTRDPSAPDSFAPFNQLVSNSISPNSYYVFSPDMIYSGSSATQIFRLSTGGSITCRYTHTVPSSITTAVPQQFVVGFFNEVTKQWNFGISQAKDGVSALRWEPANSSSSSCTPVAISALTVQP